MIKYCFFLAINFCIAYTLNAQVNVFETQDFGQLSLEDFNQSTSKKYFSSLDRNKGTYSFSSNEPTDNRNEEIKELPKGFYKAEFAKGTINLKFVDKAAFSVAVMNYSNLDKILKFEKFELGIELPKEIQAKVDNFVKNAVVPSNQKLNPYVDLPLDINKVAGLKVTAEYFCYETGEVFTVDGFYNQEFKPYSKPLSSANGAYTDAIYNSLGGYTPISSPYSFLNRFAPNTSGLWLAKIKITSPGIDYESNVFSFNVVDSENPGYVGVTDNGRYLKHNEKTFIPIGCNALWPQNTVRMDPELWKVIPYNEQYLGNSKMIPRTYDKFRERLSAMADSGANSFRIIFAPWAIDIEYGQLGNYTMHQFQAQEIDNIIELAEKKDFFIQLDMSVHYPFIPKGDLNYGTACSWDQGCIYGPHNAYKDIPGVNTPLDFFSNATAKEYYKQRIRYILARWGYSTQLSIIELMSEINQVGSNETTLKDNVGPQVVYLQNPKVYATWNKEMAAYFKSHHNGKIHLLTSGYASFGSIEDDSYEDPNFDVIGINKYDDGIFSFGSFVLRTYSRQLLNSSAEKTTTEGNFELKINYENPRIHPKPLIISESGINGGNISLNPPAYSKSADGCEENFTEIKRQMWQLLFSGVAASYQWDAVHYPEIWSEYKKIAEFTKNFDFGNTENPFRPGASTPNEINGNEYWTYDKAAVEFMENEKSYLADCIYLVSKDKSMAIGVITNKTYNLYSSSTSTVCNLSPYTKGDYGDLDNGKYVLNVFQSPYAFSQVKTKSKAIDVDVEDVQIGLASNSLKLSNMNNGGYTFYYYNRSNFDTITPTSSDKANGSSNLVSLEQIIKATENDYIIPFIAIQKNVVVPSEEIKITPSRKQYVQSINVLDKIDYSSRKELDKITVSDANGNEFITVNSSSKKGQIDVRKLKAGIYLVNFYQAGVLIRSEKIYKN